MLTLFILSTIVLNFWYLFEFNNFILKLHKNMKNEFLNQINPSIFISESAVVGLKYLLGIRKISSVKDDFLSASLARTRAALFTALTSFTATIALLLSGA